MTKRESGKLKDILFELGTEELPATSLADIFESPGENILEVKFKKLLEAYRIDVTSCRVRATGRRLVFFAQGAQDAQRPRAEMIKILPKESAFGADGQPTEKFLSILKHRGFTLNESVVSGHLGKEFVFIKQSESTRKTASCLPEIFEKLVRSLAFPKNMKWDDSGIVFPRPIRNALCFLGDRSLSFKIGHTRVKNETVIFSKSKRTVCAVKHIPDYFALLKKNGILLDPIERKKTIHEILIKMAQALGGQWAADPFLLNEVNFLVENPQGLWAPFDAEFLKLPAEVLTVSMARKQRLFGLVDKNGRVLPKFLAILDGKASEKDKRVISNNMEHILHAKLQDSLFFYQEDLKMPLEQKRQELTALVFLKNTGSMLEKSDRLVKLSVVLADQTHSSEQEKKDLERACYLSKADLLTQMVGEFPELQGTVGQYYALANGENSLVAQAIGEQYLPRTVQDKLPQTRCGSLLSILDKCDLITAAFTAGIEPTSSLDPYGLRRSAGAVIKIILDKKLEFSLSQLLEQFLTVWASPRADGVKSLPKTINFFKERFKAFLTDQGVREDLVEAALATNFSSPYETFLRVEALSEFIEDRSFAEAWKVVERTAHILKSNQAALPDVPESALFQEDLERRVFESYEKSRTAIQEAIKSRNFRLATSLYAAAFFDIVNAFFEKVFVNAEDLTVRKNRLALLCAVNRLYTAGIADLSHVHLAPAAAVQ